MRVSMKNEKLRIQEETAAPRGLPIGPGEQPFLSTALLRWGIGSRLVVWILLINVVSIPLSTALQLYVFYRREVGFTQQRLNEIGQRAEGSLSTSMSNLDAVQIRSFLGGILTLPDIHMIEARVYGLNDPITLRKNSSARGRILVRDFPIRRQEKGVTRVLGVLHVEASLDALQANMRRQALIIFLTRGAQIFVFSLVVLFFFYRMVTRHLIAFAAHLRQYDPRNTSLALTLNRKPPTHPDELDLMVQSFNETSQQLHLLNRELAGANAALEDELSLRQISASQLYRTTHYDELTDLANRALTVDRLQQAIANAQRNGSFCAVLMLDLDNFKSVNDTCGHAAGDELLKQASTRLLGCIRGGDTLSRMGGDEFLILLPGMENTIDAQKIAERVVQAFTPPFETFGQRYFITASIGISVFPSDGSNDTELMCNADSALYQAKALGRNRYEFFTAEINGRVQRRLGLERRLRGAAERGEFVLHYQPIQAAHSNLPAAFEALIRWRQSDGTLEAPGTFIPLAEELGLIEEIGNWVIETACRQGVLLGAAFSDPPRICVNVSPRQLRNAGFADWVKACLDRAKMAPELLEIEITEGVLMDERREVAANIAQLCGDGIRLSIDDFGTGYSSLAYLQRYPFDTLKIDRTFVSNIDSNMGAQRLVEGIINMAKGLGLETVAEGVETEVQREFLQSHGCDFLQGFLLGRPVSLENHLSSTSLTAQ